MARRKGAQYKCEECGLIVTVAEPCGCEPTCELVCCGEPMKEVKKHKKWPLASELSLHTLFFHVVFSSAIKPASS